MYSIERVFTHAHQTVSFLVNIYLLSQNLFLDKFGDFLINTFDLLSQNVSRQVWIIS